MIYVVYYSDGGIPKTALSPSIVTYKKVSDGSDVASPPAVSEIGGGFYKFVSTPSEALVVRVDGGAALADAYRYKVMQITPHDGDLDAQISTRGSQTDLTAIKAKTDNLPADPASNTQVSTRLASASYSAPDNISITAIKSKTDNLPANPAVEGTAFHPRGWRPERQPGHARGHRLPAVHDRHCNRRLRETNHRTALGTRINHSRSQGHSLREQSICLFFAEPKAAALPKQPPSYSSCQSVGARDGLGLR